MISNIKNIHNSQPTRSLPDSWKKSPCWLLIFMDAGVLDWVATVTSQLECDTSYSSCNLMDLQAAAVGDAAAVQKKMIHQTLLSLL